MKTFRAWAFFFAVCAAVAAPLLVNGQIVPQESGVPAVEFYNLCKFGQLLQNIINFMITGVALPLAALLFAYAGVLYVTGGSNPGRITKARKIFKNVLIGFLIAVSGWLVVNTIMTVVFSKDFFTGAGWYELECVQRVVNDPKDIPEGGARLIDTSISDLIEEVVPTSKAPAVVYEPIVTRDGALGGCQEGTTYDQRNNTCVNTKGEAVGSPVAIDNEFTYDAGIEAQRSHASPTLANLLNCMAGRLPSDVGRISSISDRDIVNGTKTWAQCRAGGQGVGCAHVVNSYHYGGASCGDQSYAADFGDEENALSIIKAAEMCGGRAAVHNGNHVHVSVGSCSSADAGD